MQGTKDLTQGTIKNQLFKLALPIMATSFIQMAYSLTDMAWVGRLGSESVAAIGAIGILMWTSSAIAILNKVGSEVSIGQSLGAYNYDDARKYASHNISMALLISIVLGSLLFTFATPIVSIFKLDESISLHSVSYLKIITTAFPFLFLSLAFTGIYNASGRSNIPFYASGAGLILNMILDPLFIFVFKWGINGAALATWISQAVVFFLFVYQIKIKDHLLNGFPFIVKLQRSYSFRIIKLGLPVATFNVLFSFVNMFLSRVAAEQGGHIGLMSLTTGSQIEAITWNTAQGVSTALGAFIAQNFAAGKIERVLKSWKITLWFSGIVGSITSLLFICFGPEIFSIFVPEKAAYMAGGRYLYISGFSQLFMMLEITTQGVFYGLGKTTPPAIISVTLNYARIPLSILLAGMGMGIDGIWWAVSATSIAKGLVLALWFFCIKNKILKTNQMT